MRYLIGLIGGMLTGAITVILGGSLSESYIACLVGFLVGLNFAKEDA